MTLGAHVVLRDDYDDSEMSSDIQDVIVNENDAALDPAMLRRSQYSILLVDDEESILLSVGQFLEDSGYGRVQTYEDAISAYRMLTDENAPRFDLIISDVRMPQMDGIEFLKALRSTPETLPLPVVLLTAKGQTMDRIAGYDAGADAYIPKPFDPKELVAIVDGLLEKQELLGSPNINIQDLQRDLGEIKDLLLQQGGGGSLVPGFVRATDVFLPPDEQEVLELLCKGKTNKEIAQETYLSTRRVEQLLTHMYRKAEVSNRTQLVRWAVATGHVKLND